MARKLITSFFLLFFISCGSDDNKSPENEDPSVTTINALIGNTVIVTFTGNYSPNGNEITDIGFEYALNSEFTSNKITLFATNQGNNQIFYELSNGIEQNITYYYRAFVKAGGAIFYGSVKNFIYDGSVSPEITSLSSEFGHIEDTLQIRGLNFIDPLYDTFVEFDTFSSQIVSLSDTLITCVVPFYMEEITNDIWVKIDNRADSYSSFTLYTPTIASVIPIEAKIGDTITMNGAHFDLPDFRNKVHLGNIEASVFNSDRTQLNFIVPPTIESPSESITLTAQLQEVTHSENFQLAAPEITSITPLSATFGDEVTINGNNFDFDLTRNKVFFGNIEAQINYADPNTLIAIVPNDLESSSESIKVMAQLQETTFNQNFELIQPIITFVPPNVYTEDDITIEGAYFHPENEKNIVTIEDIPVSVDSGDTENLNTTIPRGPFPRRKAIVRVQVLDIIVEYEIEINILDPWIMITDELPFKYNRAINNAVVANNEAYVMAPIANTTSGPIRLWKFNQNEYSWEQSNIPFNMRGTAVAESNGSKVYLYSAESDNSFYEYDPVSQQWTALAPFPGERRDWATHFTINGDIYIGMGADFDPFTSIKYGNFFKYSPTTNTWTEIAEFTYQNYFLRTETASFTLNNVAYVGHGATNTGMKDFWSYQPSTDEWIRVADFVDARHYSASFEINGFGYVTCGNPVGGSNRKDCYRYDPVANTWTEMEEVGRMQRGGHFAFALNGKAYVGSGGITVSGGTTGYDFYEYIPD